ATIRRTTAALAATLLPIRQNVALTPVRFNRSRIRGVSSGSGPSSNVNATPALPVRSIEPPGPLPLGGVCCVCDTGWLVVLAGVGFGLGFGVGVGTGVAVGVG